MKEEKKLIGSVEKLSLQRLILGYTARFEILSQRYTSKKHPDR